MEYNIAIINSSSFGRRFLEHMERLYAIGNVDRMDVKSTMHGKELADTLQAYNIIISSVTPFFDAEFFKYKKDTLLISRHGIGFNNIDIAAAKAAGTHVTIVSPLVERDAVAENAVTNLLAVMRKTSSAQEAVKNNQWKERAAFVGNNLSNKTAGIIGCGNIGSRVAEILKYGFQTKVLVCDPKVDAQWVKKHDVEVVDLNTLCSQADVISMNASLNDSSYHMLSDDQFQLMKQGVYITNTARGDLLDEEAVVRALKKGILAGFASDVMHEEPAFNSHPYLQFEQVLITPHTSAYTFECLRGMGEKCVSDVENVVHGDALECLVTK